MIRKYTGGIGGGEGGKRRGKKEVVGSERRRRRSWGKCDVRGRGKDGMGRWCERGDGMVSEMVGMVSGIWMDG